MNIQGKKVVLRAIEERDLEDLQRWANEPSIQSMLGGWHFPVSARDQDAWIQAQTVTSNDQRFAIETGDGLLIGTANLVSIDWQNGHAFHGMLLGRREFRGRGYALDAVMSIMRFAFDELRLHRLDGDMIEYNAASIKFYIEKCGWTREGVKREWYFRKGRRWDKVIVGITRDDYCKLCEDTGYWIDADA